MASIWLATTYVCVCICIYVCVYIYICMHWFFKRGPGVNHANHTTRRFLTPDVGNGASGDDSSAVRCTYPFDKCILSFRPPPPQATGSTPSINNTTTEGDDSTPDTDALSEVSDKQQHNTTTSFSVMPPVVVNNTNAVCYTPLSATVPTVSLPPVPPRIKEKIISGEFIDLATLLPMAMFLGSIEPETPKSLTVHLTVTGNDLSVRPQPSSKKISSFVSWMEAWNIYLAIIINHSPPVPHS